MQPSTARPPEPDISAAIVCENHVRFLQIDGAYQAAREGMSVKDLPPRVKVYVVDPADAARGSFFPLEV